MAKNISGKNAKRSKQLTGVAGEYFVAAELSKRGFVASITLRNTDGIDILASSSDGSKTVAIQVKTSSTSSRKWQLNKKAENLKNSNLFYVFVNLVNKDGLDSPEYFIVKSNTVANYVKRTHKEWLNSPGIRVKKRSDTSMRIFEDPKEMYLEEWDTLGI